MSAAARERALSPGRALFPPEQAAAMKTAAAIKSDRYVFICLARRGVYSGPKFIGKRVNERRRNEINKAIHPVCINRKRGAYRRLDKMGTYNYNIITSPLSFEWDERKSLGNKKKHGLCFEEAKTAFFDENALLIHDPDHSVGESRLILLGLDKKIRTLVVYHAYRKDDQVIRIISARRASRQEQRQYWQRWQK